MKAYDSMNFGIRVQFISQLVLAIKKKKISLNTQILHL